MVWLIVIAIIIGLALVLHAGLVAFAGYVLLGIYLLSRWLARHWITNLQAERRCDATPRDIGEAIEVTVLLTNKGLLPILWVIVEDLIPKQVLRQKPVRIAINGKRLQVVSLSPWKTKTLRYSISFRMRGYYPIGPTMLETGDVFGLHRRHRVIGKPIYVIVYPKVVPLPGYNFASQRPIGEIRLQNRLFEDPTRIAGAREYQVGDPLQRVHWKVTARTGVLHCRVFEPTSLTGATLLLDFHSDGFPSRGEPHRSELAITTTASLAYAVSVLNQQVGLASNGRDAADRIREESLKPDSLERQYETRDEPRDRFELKKDNNRIRPVVVETRRGFNQFQQIRETLARLELTDGFSFAQMILEMAPRLPRDATAICILPQVTLKTALALGTLRRLGFAVTVVLIGLDEPARLEALGKLLAETVRDIHFVNSEADLAHLGENIQAGTSATYDVDLPLV
jgi:uncharacterized repeat protein (TIGR01451 family)